MLHTTLDAPGNGLRLRVHRFHDDGAPASGLVLLLLHGYMDAGGTWDLVAPSLTAAGHVLLRSPPPGQDDAGQEDGKPRMDSLVKLVRWLLDTYHLSPDVVRGHCDCCATNCPGENFPWAEFRARLR